MTIYRCHCGEFHDSASGMPCPQTIVTFPLSDDALAEAIRGLVAEQQRRWIDDPGKLYVSLHPGCGGSHGRYCYYLGVQERRETTCREQPFVYGPYYRMSDVAGGECRWLLDASVPLKELVRQATSKDVGRKAQGHKGIEGQSFGKDHW